MFFFQLCFNFQELSPGLPPTPRTSSSHLRRRVTSPWIIRPPPEAAFNYLHLQEVTQCLSSDLSRWSLNAIDLAATFYATFLTTPRCKDSSVLVCLGSAVCYPGEPHLDWAPKPPAAPAERSPRALLWSPGSLLRGGSGVPSYFPDMLGC